LNASPASADATTAPVLPLPGASLVGPMSSSTVTPRRSAIPASAGVSDQVALEFGNGGLGDPDLCCEVVLRDMALDAELLHALTYRHRMGVQ
jgi:hypothetical protein